ncbi:MAG: tetratricopeptide repeat protein [Planctomycetia bacterium]|nr:tetratricopeptide repeat protein [Planctomycetia bacterium]
MHLLTRIAVLAVLLFAGNGCLHSKFGDFKLPKSTKAEEKPGETAAVSETELSGKPAATLALTMAEELEKAGKDGDAIAYYEKARAADPTANAKAARRLAVLYDRAGDPGKAMQEFRELLKTKPKDPDLLNDIGYSHYNRNEWTEAETHFRKALDYDKTHKRAWVNLGLTLAQQGRTDESLSAFEKAVSPAEAKSNLAFVLATQGKRDAATNLYREALSADSTLKSAQTALAALEKATAVEGN